MTLPRTCTLLQKKVDFFSLTKNPETWPASVGQPTQDLRQFLVPERLNFFPYSSLKTLEGGTRFSWPLRYSFLFRKRRTLCKLLRMRKTEGKKLSGNSMELERCEARAAQEENEKMPRSLFQSQGRRRRRCNDRKPRPSPPFPPHFFRGPQELKLGATPFGRSSPTELRRRRRAPHPSLARPISVRPSFQGRGRRPIPEKWGEGEGEGEVGAYVGFAENGEFGFLKRALPLPLCKRKQSSPLLSFASQKIMLRRLLIILALTAAAAGGKGEKKIISFLPLFHRARKGGRSVSDYKVPRNLSRQLSHPSLPS